MTTTGKLESNLQDSRTLQERVDQAIQSGSAELASIAQGEFLGLKPLNTPENPKPSGITKFISINESVENSTWPLEGVKDPRISLTPKHKDFLRGAAEGSARGTSVGHVALSSSELQLLIDQTQPGLSKAPAEQALDDLWRATSVKQAELVANVTGRFRMDNDGAFTAVAGGDTVYGKGDPEVVRSYLEGSGFEQTDNSNFPDVQTALHNVPGLHELPAWRDIQV